MKAKMTVSNFLILVSPGGAAMVYAGEKFLKIRVPTIPHRIFETNSIFRVK